jgi:hypothetical protein
VPEEEDQVRWQDAVMHTLPELQDGMHIHAGREEEAAAEGVGSLNAPDRVRC